MAASLPGQVVLVLQGGGALGVYQALHEAGIEPDWVIGTSIGAINGAIIAGNRAEDRLQRLADFWDKVRIEAPMLPAWWPAAAGALASFGTFMTGRSVSSGHRFTIPPRCAQRSAVSWTWSS